MSCNPSFDMNSPPYTKFDGDDSTVNFVFDFPFIGQAGYIAEFTSGTMSQFIRVYTQTGDGPWSEITDDIVMPDNTSVTFDTAPGTGTTVLIKRDSNVDNILVPFAAGSPIVTGGDDLSNTTSNISIESLQVHYLLQELGAAIMDVDCAATAAQDFAGNVYRWTANGSTYNYTMNTASSTTGDTSEAGLVAAQVLVTIDGIDQQTDQYTVADSGGYSRVEFVNDVNHPAPYNGAKVQARILSGAIAVDSANIADGSVTCAKLADGSICQLSKFGLDSLATNKQILGFFNPGSGVTLSVKTLDSTWISGFTAAVQAIALNTLAVPTGNVNMNSKKIIMVLDPTADQDAATKKYVDDSLDAFVPPGLAHIYSTVVTLASSSAVSTVTAGGGSAFDWDSVIITYDESNVATSYTPSSGTVQTSSATANTYPHSWHVLGSECGSYITCIFRHVSTTLNGKGFQVLKSGNNCNLKLTDALMSGIKLKLFFTKNG